MAQEDQERVEEDMRDGETPTASEGRPVPLRMVLGPSMITVGELMAKRFPPTRPLVDGLIYPGLSLLIGASKIGKSWLSLALAIAVATGEPLFGALPVQQAGALYLALEDSHRRLKGRLERIAAGGVCLPSDELVLDTAWPRLAEGTRRLDDFLASHRATKLVIVDVLAKLRPIHSHLSGSAYDADYRDLSQLQQVALAHEVALVVVHHTTKQSHDDWLLDANGTSGLGGAADNILALKRDRGRNTAVLHATGREIEGDKELALVWDAQRCLWMLASDADRVVSDPIRAKALEIVASASEPVATETFVQTLEPFGLSEDAVKMRLSRMVQEGELSRPARGLYTLPKRLAGGGSALPVLPRYQGQPGAPGAQEPPALVDHADSNTNDNDGEPIEACDGYVGESA